MIDNTSQIRWQMSDAMRRLLLKPAGLPIADWLRDGTATVIKDAPHRAVYRVRLPGLDCHVKHYRILGFRSRVRQMIRPVKARREFEIAAELRARGIPTPDPVAWGVEGGGFRPSASWLITKTIADSVPLNSYLESTLPALGRLDQVRIRQRMAREVANILAALHAAGVVHHDLHPGNLLCRIGPDAEPLLWLIDLHAVSTGPPTPWTERQANLIVFNRYFQMIASRSDRLRFWHQYCAVAGTAVPVPARIAGCDLEIATHQSNLQFWRARDARGLRSNRYYQRFRSPAARGFAVRDLNRAILDSLSADPEAPFRDSNVRVLKDSRSSTVIEFDLPDGRRVIYKRFRITDRRDPWLGLMRRSAAIRSWVFGHGLHERCLPTARPLAVLHRHVGALPREGYLLTEKIEGAVDLHEFTRRLATLPYPDRTTAVRERTTALARLIRALHDRGLSHRDLKASNLLTSGTFDDYRFWFIDLVGVRRRQRITRQRKTRDLMRLHVSFLSHPLITRTEKLRFLLIYLRASLNGSSGWKDWWRGIATATRAKLARNARTGRPIG